MTQADQPNASPDDSNDSAPAANEGPDSTANSQGNSTEPQRARPQVEQSAFRGEMVFLSVVATLIIFFSLAGIPGEADKQVSDASDRLRQGWLEEQLLKTLHAPKLEGKADVRIGDGSTGLEDLGALKGTWMESIALEEMQKKQLEDAAAQEDQ